MDVKDNISGTGNIRIIIQIQAEEKKNNRSSEGNLSPRQITVNIV